MSLVTQIRSIFAKTAPLPATPANEQGNVEIIEDHIHNYERAIGIAAIPTATHFGDVESLTPFVATSGNGVFGAACNVLGTGDTPVRAGSFLFDPRRLYIIDVSNANPYIIRVIWGTAAQSAAQAETAGQYSDSFAHQQTAAGNNKPQDVWMKRLPAGTQVWVKIKNNTNNATLNFLITVHEYPAP